MKTTKSILIFSFLTMITLIALTFSASAKAKETTYIAAESAYSNTYATAYINYDEFKISYPDGKTNTVYTFDGYDYDREFQRHDIKFFIRGSTVYYSETSYDKYAYTMKKHGNHVQEIHQVKKNGTDTVIAKNVGDIVGGYGEDIITIDRYTKEVFRIHSGKATKLFTVSKKEKSFQNTNVTLFGGKLYFDNKVYNLDTGKTSTFTAKSLYATKKYLYYISGVNNLVMLDLNNVKTYLDKNVDEVIGGNTNKNAIYLKANTFYRVSSTGKIYKLTTKSAIKKTGYCENPDTYQALLVNGKVYIAAYEDYHQSNGSVVCIKNTGGKLSLAFGVDCLGGWNALGTTIYYTGLYFDDEPGCFYNTFAA